MVIMAIQKQKITYFVDISMVNTFRLAETVHSNLQCKYIYHFQTERKFLQSEAAKDCNLLSKSSLAIELVKEHKDDVKMAQLMKYKAVQCKTYQQLEQLNNVL